MAPGPLYATLTANTVRTLTLDAVPGCDAVRVVTDGTSASRVYFTVDGSTPTIDGDGTYFLLGGTPGRRTVPVRGWAIPPNGIAPGGAPVTVKLVSAGTPWVAVEATLA